MVIYFDNNGTTRASPQAKKAMVEWFGKACNASAHSEDGKKAKILIDKFKAYILKHCGVKEKTHTVMITSGGSESNSFIISSCARSYHRELGKVPHIVISAVEHKSILEASQSLFEDGEIEYTIASTNKYGLVELNELKQCIQENTCLISIMFANNELGSINDVKSIADYCHKQNIPFHTDAVQIFGKYKVDIGKNNIDALSASFHKLYCGMGIGILILSNKLIDGYKLCPLIAGAQQNGLRGGTENVPAIAGAYAGMIENFKMRAHKNKLLLELCSRTINRLGKVLLIKDSDNNIILESVLANTNAPLCTITILGVPYENTNRRLPNTLLISILKHSNRETPFCNVKLKKFLESNNIYTSIGSACNTSSKNASHVLTTIGVDAKTKQGTLRISFGDDNTRSEVDKFTTKLLEGISKQIRIKLLPEKLESSKKKIRKPNTYKIRNKK